ncbi:uncharacterized protein PRCAT00003133001 [Priceomyces carsonii]|uniref:uncharacterized protein n=1 Tax=Priceomyces carsonii TaxID=28549 RepID=UPI002ED8448C|nr:unnamed protein product [Priceomyces carsonii]
MTLVYLYPDEDHDVNDCIRYVLSQVRSLSTPSINYFNKTIPDKLLYIVGDDDLSKLIDYNKVDDLPDLLNSVNSVTEHTVFIVESLGLIVANTKLDYNELNSMAVDLFQTLKKRGGYIIDENRNNFVVLNCHKSLAVSADMLQDI